MAERNEAYIVGACRSAIGTLHGGLGGFTATQLGAFAVREAVKRAGVNPADIEEVIMGHVVQGGVGQAPARQAALNGGIPPEVACLTINKAVKVSVIWRAYCWIEPESLVRQHFYFMRHYTHPVK